jgi:tetratricopeptide (TPR) repeat protein
MKTFQRIRTAGLFCLIAALIFSISRFPLFSQDSGKKVVLSSWKSEGVPGNLVLLYPHDGTLFPPDMVAPTFRWKDQTGKADSWLVIADIDGEVEVSSDLLTGQEWKPDPETWSRIKQKSQGKNIQMTVMGVQESNPEKILSGTSIFIQTSYDEVGAPIFYRDVPLPFEFAYNNLDRIRWRLGNVSMEGPTKIILERMPLCGNCHTFTKDGSTLAMDVDYANDKGSYVISRLEKETVLSPDKIITWSDYRREDGEMTFGLLSQISPDGRFVLSTVKDRSIFVPIDNLNISQLFFPIKGIIAVYDRETQRFWALPGADDPDYCQSNPTWSLDGKTVVFARAPVYHSKEAEASNRAVLDISVAREFIDGTRGFRYDLYRISFNKGQGGTPHPIPGASNNGMSNYFPRFSPDGKWIVFCQAKNFMLLQPDSKLYIIPSEGGTPREMMCNMSNLNSWHTWSPNGKWLAFASKELGPYTQLYLTHIDENGQDSPPVLLENFVLPERAVNIPEFVDIQEDNWDILVDSFTETGNYYVRIGEDKYFAEDYQGAIEAYDKAFKNFPNSSGIYIKRGDAKFGLNDFQGAIDDYSKALEVNPSLPIGYKNRADVKFRTGDVLGAVEDYDEAIMLDPDYPDAYDRRAMAKFALKNLGGALEDINKAIQLKPEMSVFYINRAFVRLALKDYEGVLEDYNKAIELKPEDPSPYERRARVKMELQDLPGALDDLTKAIQIDNGNFDFYSYRGDVKYAMKDLKGAVDDYSQSIKLNPDYALNYYKRGMVKLIMGNRQEGCSDLQKAYDLGYKEAMAQIQKNCKDYN